VTFPKNVFGVCPACNGAGADYPASALTSADAQGNLDTDGNGTELEYYQGKYWCRLCIEEDRSRKESLREAEKDRRDITLRGKAGFSSTVS